MEISLKLLIFCSFTTASHGIVDFDCKSASHYCLNDTTVLTCKTTRCVLKWTTTPSQEIADFTCIDSIGYTESSGIYSANLTGKNQAGSALISTLRFVETNHSLAEKTFACIDGFDGHVISCTLVPMNFDDVLENITVKVINYSWIIEWSPPHHARVSQYILNIIPVPQLGGLCATGQCTTNVEHITITGLEFNINYTVSIVASACNTVSHAVTTYILIEENATGDTTTHSLLQTTVAQFISIDITTHSSLQTTAASGPNTSYKSLQEKKSIAPSMESGSGNVFPEEHDAGLQVLIAVSTAVIAVTVFICLFVVMGCVIYSRKKVTKQNNVQEHFDMTHNPVYDATHDPIYDQCIPTVNNSAYSSSITIFIPTFNNSAYGQVTIPAAEK